MQGRPSKIPVVRVSTSGFSLWEEDLGTTLEMIRKGG